MTRWILLRTGILPLWRKVGDMRIIRIPFCQHSSKYLRLREEEITAWVMLDTLTTEQPAWSYEDYRRLYMAVEEDYMDVASKQKRFKKIQENEYYNALQIKFAYAVTCHKAQGGQWDAVFIDPGWQGEDSHDDEYWRWLYTAFTRARKKLYLINFKDEMIEMEG